MSPYLDDLLILAKVPLLVAKAVVLIKALTPPNIASESEQVEAQGFERVFKLMLGVPLIISKIAFFTDAAIKISCLLAAAFPSNAWATRILTTLTTSPKTPLSTFQPSISWVCGMVILLVGGAFRLSAFRALGRHFTFDLAVLKDHKLITSGPYQVVRHPSYTGLMGMMWGTTITIGSRGSWTREILWETLLQGNALVFAGIATRTRMEDDMLRKEFGEQWADWARVTKWKLFPGVY